MVPQPRGPAASPAVAALRSSENRKTGPKTPQIPCPWRAAPVGPPCCGTGPGGTERARPEGTVTQAGAGRAQREPPGVAERGGVRAQGHRDPARPLSPPSVRLALRRPLSAHSDPARAASSPHPAPGRDWPRPPSVSTSPPPIGRLPPVGGHSGRFLIRDLRSGVSSTAHRLRHWREELSVAPPPASPCHWPSNLFSGFRFSALAHWTGRAAAIGRTEAPGGGTGLRSSVHWPAARREWQEGEGGGPARGEGCVR